MNLPEEQEYFVHIMNWPIMATSAEEAAMKAAQSLRDNPTCFVYRVTLDEIFEPGVGWDSESQMLILEV